MATQYLEGAQLAQPMSILAEEFPTKLSAFNALTRDLRESGVVIKALAFPDNKIFIDTGCVELLSRRFGHELRGVRSSADGRFVRNTASIRGMGVVWFSLMKEQEQ